MYVSHVKLIPVIIYWMLIASIGSGLRPMLHTPKLHSLRCDLPHTQGFSAILFAVE